MSLHELTLVAAMACVLLPVIAILLRDRSPYMTVPAVITGAAIIVQLAVILRYLQIGEGPPIILARILMGSMFVSLLGGYVLSTSFGRENPAETFRDGRRMLGIMAFVGLFHLVWLGSTHFLTGHEWSGTHTAISIGWVGKSYLTYLLIGMIFVGYNLEKTYRIASPSGRHKLRVPLVATFLSLFYGTVVLTMGMLYEWMGMGKFVLTAFPVGIASLTIGIAYMRGGLSDIAAPVSRNIVYSSFTAMIAGLLVAAVGIAGQVAGWTNTQKIDEILVWAFGILLILATGLLMFSNRFLRQVRRFIDRNFYVNRYDYRTQWSKVTNELSTASKSRDVLYAADKMLRDIFVARSVTLALKDRTSDALRPVVGAGVEERVTLQPETPLFEMLRDGRRALLIDRRTDDFTFIPVYAENGDWLEQTASEIVAPLFDGNDMIGAIGLARSDEDDPLTYEDASLLESIGGHVAAELRSAELTEELAEAQEVELLSNLSTMILHDLKNYVSPLKLATSNLERFRHDPDAVSECARAIDGVSTRMTTLIRMLSDLRESSKLTIDAHDANELLQEVVADTSLLSRKDIDVELRLEATRRVACDRAMIRRVLENLVGNAVEAMPDGGKVTLSSVDAADEEGETVRLSVSDSGVGMSNEFLHERLFRPFATTKKGGTGLGLYQCRSIVRLHGGRLVAESVEGQGTTFELTLSSQTLAPSRATRDVAETATILQRVRDESNNHRR